jgi:hypothetical protein
VERARFAHAVVRNAPVRAALQALRGGGDMWRENRAAAPPTPSAADIAL